jgi:phosphoribosylanthranilate isomerase
MRRTRVKICGISRPEDGLAAAGLGVDAIGLVFYAPSPRCVDIVAAKRIIGALPPFVTAVGLFVNATTAEVQRVLRQVPLGMLQFHGDEEADYCASFGLPFLKAVPMGSAEADIEAYARRFTAAAGLLLDSHGEGRTGGSGQGFAWERIPINLIKPIILAGGLNPVNVAEAVRRVQPYGIDVSSGVESAKGIKDRGLIEALMWGVKKGENSV